MPKGTRRRRLEGRCKTLFNLSLVLWHLPQTLHLAWGPPVKLAEGGTTRHGREGTRSLGV